MSEENTLTPRTDEILSILQEECAEVIQAISKVKRFGTKNNIDQLALEIGDMLYLTDLARLQFDELINFDHTDHRRMKFEKLSKYSNIFKDTTYRKRGYEEETIPGYEPGAYVIDHGGPVYGIKKPGY